MTTVRLWQAWMRAGSYPSCFIARITPSSCHGVVELRGKEEVPGDVDLERGVRVPGDDVLITGQVHHRVVIPQHRRRRRAKNGNFGFRHRSLN